MLYDVVSVMQTRRDSKCIATNRETLFNENE